jgi:hypothetical protein
MLKNNLLSLPKIGVPKTRNMALSCAKLTQTGFKQHNASFETLKVWSRARKRHISEIGNADFSGAGATFFFLSILQDDV